MLPIMRIRDPARQAFAARPIRHAGKRRWLAGKLPLHARVQLQEPG
jgi:hypothetical protein